MSVIQDGHSGTESHLAGFPAKLLVDVFKQCKSMEGSIDTCPLLAQHAQDGSSCTLEGHIVGEASWMGLDKFSSDTDRAGRG